LSVFRAVVASVRGAPTKEKSPVLTDSLGKAPGNVSDHEMRLQMRRARRCTTLRSAAIPRAIDDIAATARRAQREKRGF
jgi:hypothetical protein